MLLGKADFIRDFHDRYGEHCVGFCSEGESLPPTPNTIRKSGSLSQGAGERGLLRGNTWLNGPSRVLAEDRPGCSDVTWRLVTDEELGQISRVIRP